MLSSDLSPEVKYQSEVIQLLHETTNFCVQVEKTVEDISVPQLNFSIHSDQS